MFSINILCFMSNFSFKGDTLYRLIQSGGIDLFIPRIVLWRDTISRDTGYGKLRRWGIHQYHDTGASCIRVNPALKLFTSLACCYFSLYLYSNCWAWWLIGRFNAFCPKGRGFESCSRPWTSPSLAVACGASALNSDTVSVLCQERLCMSIVMDLKRRYRNSEYE